MASAAWLVERPRQLSVPAPYGSSASLNSKPRQQDTIKALREKLSDYKSENTLLGNLVKDLKTERDGLSKKLAATTKQLEESRSKAATASLQLESIKKEQTRLQAEVERLSSVVHSHSIRLQKSKHHQQELEDVALDLRQELEDTRTQMEAALQAAQQAGQRAAAAEAKLVAAGLGAMPKMGPTAEQLVINSTQRIKELTEELAAVKADAAQQLAAAQQQMQQQGQHWQQQLQAAQEKQQQQEAQLQQQEGRLQESEQQCKQLQELLVGVQQKVVEGQTLAEAQGELQQLKQGMLTQSQSLQQQVCQLQGQLADAQLQHASSLAEQQQQLLAAQRQLAAAQREKQELTAVLIAVRQQESSHRLATGEATAKAERLRGELVKCVGELQVQLEGAAAAGQQHSQVLQQLRAMEATAAAAKSEAAETRQQLVELATVTIAELRQQVAGEAEAITGLPEGVQGADLPLPVSNYIKVLEHAVCDCEERCKQLLTDTLAAQQYERELRQALAAAREQQAAAERALQQQTQRLLAAERMRLSDLREAQGLEKRLVLAQQECWNLRDALLAAKAGEAAAAAAGGGAGSCLSLVPAAATAAAVCVGDAAESLHNSRRGRGGGNVAATVGEADNAQLRPGELGWQQQQQHSGPDRPPPAGLMWAVSAADAAETHAGAAAAAGAASQYHAKLAQLRQLKSQYNSSSRAKTAGGASSCEAAGADGTQVNSRISSSGGGAQGGQQRVLSHQGSSMRSAASGAAGAAAAGSAGVRCAAYNSSNSLRTRSSTSSINSGRSSSCGGEASASDLAAAATAAVAQQTAAMAPASIHGSRFGPASLAQGSNAAGQPQMQLGPSLKQASSRIVSSGGGKAPQAGSTGDDITSPKELDDSCNSIGMMSHVAVKAAAAGAGTGSGSVQHGWQQQKQQTWQQLQQVQQQLHQLPSWAQPHAWPEGLDGVEDAVLLAEGLPGLDADAPLEPEAWDAGVWHP